MSLIFSNSHRWDKTLSFHALAFTNEARQVWLPLFLLQPECGGSSNSSGSINSKGKRWSQVLQTALSFRRWAERWRNRVMTVLFSTGLIWICWLPSALCNSMKRLIIQPYSAWAVKPHTSSGINWFWNSASGLKVTIKLQKWEPDSIAGFTELFWTFGTSS